ncbi:MAG: hypothetical protein IPJ13_15730 [Saprospiraceae bacterium]|nr:hypothetical protein [Saprospiraceae bacterium]
MPQLKAKSNVKMPNATKKLNSEVKNALLKVVRFVSHKIAGNAIGYNATGPLVSTPKKLNHLLKRHI